ncbi:MAG TPA: histidine kinase [Streptosporangiaceae bacterium]|jgi:signal transduction histidine kinase
MARLFTAGERPQVPAWSLALDAVIAAAATALAISETISRAHGNSFTVPRVTIVWPGGGVPQPGWYPSVWLLAGVALMAAPLAIRRVYPVTACAIILATAIALPQHVPPVGFAAAILAVYSALVHSPHRELAVGVALAGALASVFTLPDSPSSISARYTALIVVVPTAAAGLGMREWRRRAGDSAARLRTVQAEHETATRRAIELERARIASELHDVVTHNVSVMMVQAGAARKVLGSPREDAAGLAEEALLAVEASGRTAMGELRSLLSLLAPAGRGSADAPLTPQPGLADVSALVDRVSAAGLPLELHSSLPPGGLPPGLDLAVYRVVQEGLTNVLRHAGGARTVVRISGRLEQLVITVSDDGSGTSGGAEPGRGLLGLRERVALYGGAVDAGPRPGGGWRLRATIPLPELAGA